MFIRTPAVAGIFYPSSSAELKKTIESSFNDKHFGPGHMPPSKYKRRIFGIISPHAGYAYSGTIAANGFYEISSMPFDNVVMIGPNHYRIGTGVASRNNRMCEKTLRQ